jgi:predicted nucleic acid-binding protein
LKFVLDTNVLAALMRGDPQVVERLRKTTKTGVALPQPVASEVAYGLARLPHSKRRDSLERAWGALSAEIPRMPWTDEVSEAVGRIKATLQRTGRTIDDFDVAIAAHAVVAGASLVTFNGRHMDRVPGLVVEDWSGEIR